MTNILIAFIAGIAIGLVIMMFFYVRSYNEGYDKGVEQAKAIYSFEIMNLRERLEEIKE